MKGTKNGDLNVSIELGSPRNGLGNPQWNTLLPMLFHLVAFPPSMTIFLLIGKLVLRVKPPLNGTPK